MGLRIVSLTITEEPIPCAGMESIAGSDRDRIEAITREMFTRPGAHVAELESLSKKYPRVPMLRNHLAGAMEAAGRGEEARRVIERTAREYPTYVFAFCNHVMNLLSDGLIEEARVLVETGRRGPVLTLPDFDPTRDTYHVSEAVAHASMVGHYLLATGRRDWAGVQLEILKKTAPKSAAYRRLAAAMKQDPDKLAVVAALLRLKAELDHREERKAARRAKDARAGEVLRRTAGGESRPARKGKSDPKPDEGGATKAADGHAGLFDGLGRCGKDGTAMSVGGAWIGLD